MRQVFAMLALIAMALAPSAGFADRPVVLAQGAHNPTGVAPADATTPEERMRRRFPQPVKVADLIGLPVLDADDVTLGRVLQVVRTAQGKVLLIVAYGGWLGWGTRPVAIPIEVVAIIGRQIAALDMPPEEFNKVPTWPGNGAEPIPAAEVIKIAITRR